MSSRTYSSSWRRAALPACVAVFAFALVAGRSDVAGQGRGAGAAGAPRTGRQLAPMDITGTWVAVVTEDWRWRMVTPPKGDVASIPVNAEGRKAAASWNPEADAAGGNACKAFGVGGIMRQPGRLRISWQDDQTLKLETDAGTQTRILKFASAPAAAAGAANIVAAPAPAPPAGPRSWQGDSVAVWESRRPAGGGAGGGGGGGRGGAAAPDTGRYLKVTTTNMLAGYLRKNGIPYSENAVLTEYYDYFQDPDGTTILNVTIAVDDPLYLNQRYVVIANFQKEANASKWDPSPCSARW